MRYVRSSRVRPGMISARKVTFISGLAQMFTAGRSSCFERVLITLQDRWGVCVWSCEVPDVLSLRERRRQTFELAVRWACELSRRPASRLHASAVAWTCRDDITGVDNGRLFVKTVFARRNVQSPRELLR